MTLSEMGFTGIKIEAYRNSDRKIDASPNYVIFKTEDIKIVNKKISDNAQELEFDDGYSIASYGDSQKVLIQNVGGKTRKIAVGASIFRYGMNTCQEPYFVIDNGYNNTESYIAHNGQVLGPYLSAYPEGYENGKYSYIQVTDANYRVNFFDDRMPIFKNWFDGDNYTFEDWHSIDSNDVILSEMHENNKTFQFFSFKTGEALTQVLEIPYAIKFIVENTKEGEMYIGVYNALKANNWEMTEEIMGMLS